MNLSGVVDADFAGGIEEEDFFVEVAVREWLIRARGWACC